MLIYIINILSILLYVAVIYSFNNNQFKSSRRITSYNNAYSILVTIIVIVQLFLMSVTKSYSVGNDTSVYMDEFYKISQLNLTEIIGHRWESGYVLFNKAIGIFGLDFRVFLILLNFLLYFVLFRFLMKESRIPWLSLFLFVAFDFFSFSLSGYRQISAMFITFISIKYIKESKLWKFLTVIIIASLFHQSALAFIIVYPLSKMKLNRYFYTLAIGTATFLYVFGGRIVNFVASLYHRQQAIQSGSGYNYFILITAITMVGMIIYYRFKNEVDPKDVEDVQIYIKIMIASLVLQVFSFHISVFVRVVHYFTVHLMIFIPNLITFIPEGKRRTIIFVGVALVSVILFLYFLSVDSSGITPFELFWQ